MVSLESIVELDNEEGLGGPTNRQLGQDFYDKLSKRLGERIAECGDAIPVLTGQFISLN